MPPRIASIRRHLLAVVLLAAAVSLPSTGRAAPASALTESQVQAAFLFNFAKFVTWPPDAFEAPAAPLRIGVLGDDAFGESLAHMVAGQEVQNRPIVVVTGHSADDLAGCQIVYISESEKGRLAQHLTRLRNAPGVPLTVSGLADFIEAGGMIRFVLDQNTVRFEIAAENASAAGLSISSRLLNLAINARGHS